MVLVMTLLIGNDREGWGDGYRGTCSGIWGIRVLETQHILSPFHTGYSIKGLGGTLGKETVRLNIS